MSFVDLDALEPPALVAQYVVEHRGRGAFLPYTDYEIILEWLRHAASADQVLLILSEMLPDYFCDEESKKRKSLSGLRSKVLRRIVEHRMRQLPAAASDE